jgi:hypothetical protein
MLVFVATVLLAGWVKKQAAAERKEPFLRLFAA